MYEPEDDFEQELKDGLTLRDAPEGFAERVIALAGGGRVKVSESDTRESSMAAELPTARAVWKMRAVGASSQLSRHPTLRWAIAAALLIMIAVGGYAERQRQMAGERARRQVFLALRITGSTLRAVHDRVAEGDE